MNYGMPPISSECEEDYDEGDFAGTEKNTSGSNDSDSNDSDDD